MYQMYGQGFWAWQKDARTHLDQQQEARRDNLRHLNWHQVPLCEEVSQVPNSNTDTYIETSKFRKLIKYLEMESHLSCKML